jgi:type IV secretory pathway VirJ component
MSRTLRALGLVSLLAAVASLANAEDTERFGRFGNVALLRDTPHPSHVVLFVSGDGGWNLGVVDMAKALASLDALVVGIDIRTYLAALRKSSDKCLYPASDFEALSQYLQKKLDFSRYQIPVLVGYSSGAALVYATLAQAPPNTFRGGISLGFCPDLDVAKPFCSGGGLVSRVNAKATGTTFDPIAKIATPWIAFQGTIDRVCDAGSTRNYVSRVDGAELVLLPKVGHGFSVQTNWMPQFRAAFRRLAPEAAGAVPPRAAGAAGTPAHGVPGERSSIADLPLVEVPATAGHSDRLAFIASGDGGWASVDKEIASVLAARGVPVVGLDTLQYYWQPRSPEESARALERILRHYLATWSKQRVLLIGYSRGADVLPFMASRLPADLADRIDLIALLGPGTSTTFEFHYSDWIRPPSADTTRVQPEVEKLRGKRLLCIYGADESNSLCPQLPAGLARLDPRPGGHHFGGDYRSIAERILQEAGR